MTAQGSCFDAIVIGAGPAGGTVALVLARAGLAVAVVEKRAFPRAKVCGEFMSATNAPLLDALGLGNFWRSEGGPEVRRVGLFSGETAASAPMPEGATGGFGRALGRDRLDAALLDAAREAGARVFQPASAVAMERAGESTRIVLEADGDRVAIEAPAIVAAHGSWERGGLPTQAGRSDGAGDLLGFKARFTGAALAPDLMPLLVFPGGYGGLVASDRGRVSLSCCIRRDVLARARRSGPAGMGAGEAVRRHVEATSRGVREAIGGATLDGVWLAAGPIRPGIRSAYADGVFRVGNLAGEAHPIVAEGISMAVQAGWLLAQRLLDVDIGDPRARDAAGHAYGRDWRRQFAFRIRAAEALARLALSPAGGWIGPTVEWLPSLLSIGAALSGKTTALTVEGGGRPFALS